MAERSLADRVAALEVKVGSRTIEAQFRGQAELIDRLFVYRFDEFDKRWDAKLEATLAPLKTDVAGLKLDVAGIKSDIVGLKIDVTGLKTDVATMKDDLKTILSRLGKRR